MNLIGGYISGVLCLVLKICLVFSVCYFHIPVGYAQNQSIKVTCIATSVGFGVSAIHNLLLLCAKHNKKLKSVVKILWVQQYFMTIICLIFFLHFIQIDRNMFSWFKAIAAPLLLTLEFIFYKTFIEVKPKEKIVYVMPQPKVFRDPIKNDDKLSLKTNQFTKG